MRKESMMRKGKILYWIYGDAFENRDWGGIIGMTLLLVAALGLYVLWWIPVIYLITR